MVRRKFYAVIDTNVIVSALFNWESVPGRVVQQALSGPIVPIVSEAILEEYEDVLHRDKFRFDKSRVRIVMEGIIRRSLTIDPVEVSEVMPDPDDVVFYAVTMSARDQWDARLVTGNTRHFPPKPFVVTPREMLNLIES